jgi:HPt (histidine-containing phosphotransfer) domain-containing protein
MDPREMFRTQFVETARTRCAQVGSVIERDQGAAASELHCLSGEASMLDFGKVSDLASVAEQAARSGDVPRVRKLLEELAVAIRAVEDRSEST